MGANIGTEVSINLTVTNMKDDSDLIDLFLVSSIPNGWAVSFFTGDGTWTPLADTNGDPFGHPDIGVKKPSGLVLNESINVTVNVSIPSSPTNFREFTTIGALSSTTSMGYDSALLSIEVLPFVKVSKSANPKDILLSGTGNPDRSNVVLNLTGAGIPQTSTKPQDIVLVIDVSGSMSGNDPDGLRLIGAKGYLDQMDDVDRAAVVGFGYDYDTNEASGSWLAQDVVNHPLGSLWAPHHLRKTDSMNLSSIKSDVESLNFTDGGTNIELSIQIALQELVPGYSPTTPCVPSVRPFPPDMPGDSDGTRFGNSSHWWVIVLLTDGAPSHSMNCTDDEVSFAALNRVRIFTIGLGSGAIESYLNDSMALPTGGEYIFAAEASDIPAAYERVKTLINNVAGSSIPPPSLKPMVTDIVPSPLLVDNSSIIPSPTFVGDDGSGNTKIQWNVGTIKIGSSWLASYDVTCNTTFSSQNVTLHPFATVDYMSWDNRIVSVPIPSDHINCSAPMRPLITNVSKEPYGVNITWDPVMGADLYELYGGPEQTALELELSDVLAVVPAPQTWWLDLLGPSTHDEYYYVVRAVDNDVVPERRSATSNTAGFYRMMFDPGPNTLSLPLKPFWDATIDWYAAGIANLIALSWLDKGDHWQTYPTNPSPPQAALGEGYVMELSNSSSFVFTGEPASMILHRDAPGFNQSTRGSLGAQVDPSGDIVLTWTPIPGAEYYILWSSTREGFFTASYSTLNGGFRVIGPPFTHPGAASARVENYYIVLPYDPLTKLYGSSTYSIGIWTMEFNGNEFFGLPLKPVWGDKSADWYVEQVPNSLGIVFLEGSMWKAHFKEFPEGVYDTLLDFGKGYQVSVYSKSFFSFVGR
jgi:hypothetical protein